MRQGESVRTVECPVCSCRIEGRDERELSSCVHVHFCEEHGMRTTSPGEESKVIAGGQTGYGSGIERGGTRAETPEEGSSSTSELWMQEGVRRAGARRTEEMMERREEASSSPAEGSSRSSSEPFGVECPGCKERVSGRTEGETSERFKEHMAAEHGDEPYMTRLMERLRSKL